MTMSRNRENKGFSLVELAIVIVIVGLIVTIGFKLVAPLVERTKRTAANETINAALESIIGFAEVNGRLPEEIDDPDDPDEFPNTVRNFTDTWGKDFIYIPEPNLTDDDSICARNNTSLSVESPAGTAGDVAFVLVSSGPNLNIQTDFTKTDPDSIVVYGQGVIGIDDYATGLHREEPYQDIVKWMVLPELRVRAGCFGSPLKILTVEIPSAFVLTDYDADIFAVEGIPWDDTSTGPPTTSDVDVEDDYEWCVMDDAPSGLEWLCNGTLIKSPSCTFDGTGPTEDWNTCTSLNLFGIPDADGTSSLDVFVRDDADNITSRTFGISISEVGGLSIFETYRVWNTGGSTKDFEGKHLLAATACENISDGDEITALTGLLASGSTIEKFDSGSSCGTGGGELMNYIHAIFADNNQDGCVAFHSSSTFNDYTCPL